MIVAFTRFDLESSVASRARMLAPLVLVLVLGAASPFPLIAIPAAAIVVSLSAPMPFLIDERGRLDLLYAILPINRAAVVLSRYIGVLLWFAAAAIAGTAVCYAAAAIRGQRFHASTIVATQAASFCAVGLAVAVQLPMLFAFGYTRGRPMTYIPIVVIALGCSLASYLGVFNDAMAATLVNPTAAFVYMTIGLAALAASAVVAVVIYQRRTF